MCRKSSSVGYVIGFSPNPKTQRMVKENGLKNPRRKMVKRYTTTGMAHRTIGELVNYKAKSWKQERRLIARRQHDARTKWICA